MPVCESDLRRQIVEIGRLMYGKGWVAANDGNISVRLSADRILATPTGVSKGTMQEDDLIVCDMRGNKLEGKRERTSEILMHLTVLEMRPDINSVVHAHPPVATGFATAGRALDQHLLPEVIINLGCVPLAPYGLPGTSELSDKLRPFIPDYDALLMANHGVVAYGSDLQRAFFNIETVEHFARITLIAELLGGPRPLGSREVQRLRDSRERYGVPQRIDSEVSPQHTSPSYEEGHSGNKSRYVTRDELMSLLDELVRVRR